MMDWQRSGWLGLALLVLAMDAAAERVALVIGNSQYAQASHLSNPANDARAVAAALRDLGFTVDGPHLDLTKTGLDAALLRFGRQAQAADAAVVYFAGHGIEARGRNYLIPVDARLEREATAALEAVALDVVLEQIAGPRGFRLVILDACRDNPLANQMQRRDGTRAVYRGLGRVEPEGQTYVAYAARDGTRALDGDGSAHSPFTAALLKYLREPLPLPNLFGAVREEVLKQTGNQQEPMLYGAFGARPVYLTGEPPSPPPGPGPAPPVAPAPPMAPPGPAVDHDLIAWQSAEKCGTAVCFQAYLEDYPQGRYARMAQARLTVEAPPPPPPPEPRRRPPDADSYPAPYRHIASPGFRCAGRLQPVESIICQNPALGRADGIMGGIYNDLRTALGGADADALRAAQRAWIRRRDRICPTTAADLGSAARLERQATCLRRVTDERIAELWAMFQTVSRP
jgi:uncharacterized protein YecT (DUF1311 family)